MSLYDEFYRTLKPDILPHHQTSLKDILFLLRCYNVSDPFQHRRKTLLQLEYLHMVQSTQQ